MLVQYEITGLEYDAIKMHEAVISSPTRHHGVVRNYAQDAFMT
jgi:hypothetical protein